MENEIWKDIEKYSNYQISNLGRVKSKERYVNVGIKNQKQKLKKELILKQQIDKKGYHYVRLYNSDGWKYFKIHYLAAKEFLGNPNNKPTIDHINRKKDDNSVNNLRWADYIEQANNKDKTKMIEKMKILGKKPYKNSAKKVKQYDLEGNLIKEWPSARNASLELGIKETSISNCINGYTKSSGGYIWLR